MRGDRILTTYPIPQSERWRRETTLVGPEGSAGFWGLVNRMLFRFGFQDIQIPFRLLRLRAHYDVLITGAEREDCVFAVWQALLPGRRIPHLMMCCLWRRESNRVRYWLKRSLIRLMSRSVTKFIVWSTEEIAHYADYFGLSREHFTFIPHHATLDGYPVVSAEGDYLFAGGDSSRDYATLLEAVRGLPVPVVIVTRDRRCHAAAAELPNVWVGSVTPQRFRELMAGSRAVIVPMAAGLLNSAGQQTYLNAMALRKPVVVSDAPGVQDYITQGIHGWVVPPGNSEALRGAIQRLLEDGSEVAQMRSQAQHRVQEEFTLAHFVERNLALAKSLINGSKGESPC